MMMTIKMMKLMIRKMMMNSIMLIMMRIVVIVMMMVMPMTIIVRNDCGKDPKRNSTLLFILFVEMVIKNDSWNIIATFMIMMTIRR